MVIFLQLFTKMMDLKDMIMMFRQRVVPQSRRRRAPVTWVSQWLRRREDRIQYHNLVAETYQEDHPAFTNFMRMSPEIFTEIECRLTPVLQRQTTFLKESLSPGLKSAITLTHPAVHLHNGDIDNEPLCP